MKNHIRFILVIVVATIYACGLKDNYKKKDTPTSGILNVYCDKEMITPMEWQSYTFHQLYPNAEVKLIPSDEANAIQMLFKDSVDCIIIHRTPSSAELQQFEKANVRLTQVAVAGSAFVLIADSSSTIEKASLEEISGGQTALIFHSAQSSAAQYLRDSLLMGKKAPQNWTAQENIDSLLKRLNKNPGLMGVINYALISDQDDPRHKELRKKIKIIPVSKKKGETAYYPDQSNIKTGDYPMSRKIWMIRRGGDFTLSAGFIAFVAGEKGQLFFTKLGFAPEFQHPRNIEIKTGA